MFDRSDVAVSHTRASVPAVDYPQHQAIKHASDFTLLLDWRRAQRATPAEGVANLERHVFGFLQRFDIFKPRSGLCT